MYELKYSKQFEKSVKKLPDKVKRQLSKQLMFLERDPKHSSLYSKKNHTASSVFKETIYESRIDKTYRIIWKYEDDKVILLLVAGNHRIVEGKH